MSRSADEWQDFTAQKRLSPLNSRQREVYSAKLARFATYLQEEGKDPKKGIGYADAVVTERISRFHRVMKWFWKYHRVTTELSPEGGDEINCALFEDRFCRTDGEPFADGSKRKVNDVLRNWFDFQGVDWQPEYEFSDTNAKKENKPDLFMKSELRLLTETSLTYKSIPSYNNLSPTERDNWKSHIAQELGKPKEEVVPDDWDRINNNWHVPSLVRTARSHGWRPSLVGRLSVDWYDPDTQAIHIPAGKAPKNDAPWRVELTDEGSFMLDNWLKQRELMDLYDGTDQIWLNRKGNPYDSGSLNTLLDNLIEEAGIDTRGRKLVWYSFRHSIGTYVFAETKSLRAVADQLRQKSRSSAENYVHPVPEVKREIANIM